MFATIANTAVVAGRKLAPLAYASAMEMLQKSTGGKVSDVAQVVGYVGQNPQRLSVVADALIRSGVAASDIFPADIAKINPQLSAMRDAAYALSSSLKTQFDKGADKALTGLSIEATAAIVLVIHRVKAAENVYGNAANYFLCHPNGGIPASDFAAVIAIRRAL